MLLSRHELCRIYALFWSDFDADFYADIEDFVQISARKNARWNLCPCEHQIAKEMTKMMIFYLSHSIPLDWLCMLVLCALRTPVHQITCNGDEGVMIMEH